MSCMNLNDMRTAEEQLKKQIRTLQALQEEVRQSEEKIKYMAYVNKTKQVLSKSAEALNENIRVLTSMAAALCEVRERYCQTEARITDRYNLDTVVYPKTQFAPSRITGMEDYQELMPF